jgi:hypothetical protein
MISELTVKESRAVEALIGAGIAEDAWTDPIYAVDHALRTSTEESTKIVRDLLDRDIVTPIPCDGGWRWELRTA